MGRKPNALILQYFERGDKLKDNSNRYEHTCKSCHEKFPKGRLDNLTAHLLKKCPALTTFDRQKLALEFNNLPPVAGVVNNQRQNGQLQQTAPSQSGPAMGNQWAPLRTLAEFAGRREQNVQGYESANEEASMNGKRPHLELQEQYTLDNPPVSYDGQRPRKSLKHSHGDDMSPFSTKLKHTPTSASESPNLAMAAAAACHVPSMTIDPALDPELLRRDEIAKASAASQMARDGGSMTEGFMDGDPREAPVWHDEASSVNMSQYPEFEHSKHRSDGEPSKQSIVYPHSAITTGMTEFSTEYGNGEKSMRPKLRSKFNETRRKEVQEVRKKGACIRCRMLRKPCGQDDPCVTCKGVECARLWKDTCRRDRIEQYLDIFSAGLHTVLASNEVNKIKSRFVFKTSITQVEAFHYPNTIPAIFKSVEGLGRLGDIDASMNDGLASPTLIRLLDSDNDDLVTKVEAYMKRICYVFYEQEPSTFMHITLQTALAISCEKQDDLLSKTLEFWALVHMLIDPDIDWQIMENGFVYDLNAPNHKILRNQINAAVERKVEKTSKAVLPGLERRLNKNPTRTRFETFISAIILLNCIEKATWLFNCWEESLFTHTWPLEKSPRDYTSQVDDLTSLMRLLLHLRSCVPKTFVNEQGLLASDDGDLAKEYFDALELNAAQVADAQANPILDLKNSRSYELRYCAMLLLPEGEMEA